MILKRLVAAALGAAALGYAGLLGALYLNQESLLFAPQPLAQDYRFGPREGYPSDQRFDEVRIPVDGAILHALHFRQPRPRGLVFYLHGNGGNLSHWTRRIGFFREAGFDVFMIDYRGYGKSSGEIASEAQLLEDVRAAWAAVAPQYAGRPRVIFGRSLGTGPAVRLAAEVAPELLVLVSPYRSIRALAQQHYPWAPAALLRYPLDSEAAIGAVRSPVLILHGRADALIPPAHAEALAARVDSPLELVWIEGAGHHDLHRFPAYRKAFAARLAALR